eukprot:scaffold104882_cov36-Phaeocystis_antarctica.AAC.1
MSWEADYRDLTSLCVSDTKGGVFSEPSFFSGPCPADPIRAHTRPGITQGLCGWLSASGTQDLRALRLWQSSRQWRAPLSTKGLAKRS